VASGAALSATLAADGVALESVADLVRLATDAHPAVTARLRQAGQLVGEVLATLVNFENPQAVVLAGLLSTIDPFVAAVRSALYDRCLPLETRHLEIARSVTGPRGGLAGFGALARERLGVPPAP
jgi:predicted NBD/HSP70 family sugar kinase